MASFTFTHCEVTWLLIFIETLPVMMLCLVYLRVGLFVRFLFLPKRFVHVLSIAHNRFANDVAIISDSGGPG